MIKTRLEKVWLSRVPCFVEVNYGGGYLAITCTKEMLSQLIRPLPIEALSQPDWTMWHLIIGRKLTRRQQENMEMIFFLSFQCKKDLKLTLKPHGRLIAEYIGRWTTKFQTQERGLLVVIDQNFDLRQVRSPVSGKSEQAKWTHCAGCKIFVFCHTEGDDGVHVICLRRCWCWADKLTN